MTIPQLPTMPTDDCHLEAPCGVCATLTPAAREALAETLADDDTAVARLNRTAPVSTSPELTITATAHTDCHACEMSAEGARSYVANGGRITNGKAGNGQVAGGPHWATFTTDDTPALAEASVQS